MEYTPLETFFTTYHQAQSFADADEYLTTDDILSMLADHGFYIYKEDFYSWMRENGYKEDLISEMKFVWLLRRA